MEDVTYNKKCIQQEITNKDYHGFLGFLLILIFAIIFWIPSALTCVNISRQILLSVLFHPQALSRISSIHCTDDEVHEVGYPSVNAWIAWFCAPMTQDKWAYETLAWFEFFPPFGSHAFQLRSVLLRNAFRRRGLPYNID